MVQKIESLCRMQILWILFGGHNKTRLFFEFIFMHLHVFFKFNVQNRDIFVGCLFVVVVVFFLGVNSRSLV